MTSFAFIFGALRLLISGGAGAEMRFALGITVFSGMLGVTLFGIFFTPSLLFGDPRGSLEGRVRTVIQNLPQAPHV